MINEKQSVDAFLANQQATLSRLSTTFDPPETRHNKAVDEFLTASTTTLMNNQKPAE